MSILNFILNKFKLKINDTSNVSEEIIPENIGEQFEEELLNEFGKCKELHSFGLKILFITDTHNCLAYTDKYINYLTSLNSNDYDLCLLLGDLSGLDIDAIKNIVPSEKLFGVVGNHDSIDFLDVNSVSNINGKVIECKGIKIAGIMGSNRYKEKDYGMQTHEESLELSEKMETADILISHDKAYVFDKRDTVHDGLKGITHYIYKNHIPIHIHGHLHEEMEEILKNGTKSIGLYQIKLLEL
jgi:Icc-related predicted phosphoesterase